MRREIRRGARVAIFLRRSAEAAMALFATFLAGGVGVLINERLRTKQVQYIVEHSEAALVVTDAWQLAQLSSPPVPAQSILLLDENEPGAAVPAEQIIGADLALIIYTSGSTGLPKGVMLSHANLLAGAQIVSDYLGLTAADRIISLLPFSFDYGLNQLLSALFVGATLVIQRSLFPPDVCRTLQQERITGMAGVPTLWLQLTQKHSPFTRLSLPHLRYITNSGGRLPEDLVRLIRQSHPHVQIYLMYGLTEAFRSTYLPPDQVDTRPSSIGKAIPNVEILVTNEAGQACAPGEVGELVHRGPTVALGYWRNPESTARVFRPHPLEQRRNGLSETVVFSGDLVKTDDEGYLYFVGRKDKLIKSRGFRVSPEEIESCIVSSQLVANVVVFAIPRDDVDCELVAAIIPKEPPAFSEDRLRRFCQLELPDHMQPHVFWCMEAFPLTASGKPDRPLIEQLYASRLLDEARHASARQ